MTRRGLSLVEILVVIGIVAVITTAVIYYQTSVIPRTRAIQMAADMNQIKNALLSWKANNSQILPKNDDPLYINVPFDTMSYKSNPTFSDVKFIYPEYLSSIPINPVTGYEYRYDNDQRCGAPNYIDANDYVGVVAYSYTTKQYDELKKITFILDEMLDKSDGRVAGLIRWVDDGADYFPPNSKWQLHYHVSCN